MKVIVLGAGVIGVTTAYYLARAGVEVRVLDRQPGPGMETSFANAGELSYGMTSPWAAPEAEARWFVERLATLLAAAVLMEGEGAVADSFVATRVAGEGGRVIGGLPASVDRDGILARVAPG